MRHIEDGAYRDRQDVLMSDLRDVRSVGAAAFANCTQLYDVAFSHCLAVICEDAFFGCSDLSEVTLYNGCITLGERAFAKSGLRKIILPETLQIIGNSCFEDCESLEEIHLGQSLHTLGASAFSGCRKLKIVTLPNLPSVRDGCFAQTAVEQIYLPDKTAYIGRDAFAECENLRLVNMPAGDLRLRGTAFAGCSKLTHVIRRHKQAAEHRVFLTPPQANDITRKLSAYDKRVTSAPQALFRLSHPHALMADDRARFENILKADISAARAYLFSMKGILEAEDFNKALQILTTIDPAL